MGRGGVSPPDTLQSVSATNVYRHVCRHLLIDVKLILRVGFLFLGMTSVVATARSLVSGSERLGARPVVLFDDDKRLLLLTLVPLERARD